MGFCRFLQEAFAEIFREWELVADKLILPVCLRLCVIRLLDWLNDFPHTEHLWGFSPVNKCKKENVSLGWWINLHSLYKNQCDFECLHWLRYWFSTYVLAVNQSALVLSLKLFWVFFMNLNFKKMKFLSFFRVFWFYSWVFCKNLSQEKIKIFILYQ